MVGGHTQSIDSAYIDANASIDTMERIDLKDRDPDEYLKEVFDQDLPQDYTIEDKVARVEKVQKDLMVHVRYRKKKYKEQRSVSKGRVLSNATHMSRTDPDARIATKPGKPRMLCYTSTMSVDVQQNVITNIAAEHASNRDSKLLVRNVNRTDATLQANNLAMINVLADAAFSSGENYTMLEQMGITAYIPPHGTYETDREDFKYDGRRNAFICPQGQILKTTYTKAGQGRKVAVYRSKKKICDQCPIRENCVGRRGIKEIQSTPYKRQYERMRKRLRTKVGKNTYYLRMQSVEPVFGSLQQYYGLRRIYVRGKSSAYKVMLMSASAFNLKKWVKKITYLFDLNLLQAMKHLINKSLKFIIFNHMSHHSETQYVRGI